MSQEQSQPFHIERAVSSDYSVICRLITEEHAMHVTARPDIFQPCGTLLTKEEYEAMQKDDTYFLYMARTSGGETAGLCFAKVTETASPLLCKKKFLYIEDFIVSEPFRRRGIGRMLYAKIKEAAVLSGAEGAELTVWNFNESAAAFYRALGMKVQFVHMEDNF